MGDTPSVGSVLTKVLIIMLIYNYTNKQYISFVSFADDFSKNWDTPQTCLGIQLG